MTEIYQYEQNIADITNSNKTKINVKNFVADAFQFATATNEISLKMNGCELSYNSMHVTRFPETIL